jgi:site-specific DNA-methyltransferase (adenine-specific)
MFNTNTIFPGDCLELMKDIPDKSIDLIILDPPYNIGKAEWDKWKKQSDYVDWLGSALLEMQRVLKDNGSLYLFHNDFLQMVEIQNWINQNTQFVFKQLITWNKIDESFRNNGFVQQRLSIDMMRNYYNGFTEYILYYTFQDETGLTTVMLDTNNFPTLRHYFKDYQEALGLNKKQIMNLIGQNADHCFRWNSSQWDLPTKETYDELANLPLKHEFVRREYEDLRREYEDLRYTFNCEIVKQDLRANSNVWLYAPAENLGHVTPKPVDLIENIIKHSSNEGDLVLDPMCGSGTTCVAAKKLNRRFIGIELDSKYVDLARSRIDNLQTPMF